jgi:hypothetical protein
MIDSLQNYKMCACLFLQNNGIFVIRDLVLYSRLKECIMTSNEKAYQSDRRSMIITVWGRFKVALRNMMLYNTAKFISVVYI